MTIGEIYEELRLCVIVLEKICGADNHYHKKYGADCRRRLVALHDRIGDLADEITLHGITKREIRRETEKIKAEERVLKQRKEVLEYYKNKLEECAERESNPQDQKAAGF